MKTIIAMSGGVDSSVAAYLMKEKGYDCLGVTMRFYEGDKEASCQSENNLKDVIRVTESIDMPYDVLDLREEFHKNIIEKFIRVYENGGTPNPCVDCNRYMKFDGLLRLAEERGYDCIATGHYARVTYNKKSGRYELRKGLDEGKDQSYVLYNLTQEQLAHIVLPLGELHKDEVRKIAEKMSFANADKKDSQDICFVPDGDYAGFIEREKGEKYPEGDFLDTEGNVLGRHKGLIRYTLGQRKGLGVSAGKPLYVCGRDLEKGTVILGDEEELFKDTIYAEDMNWISIPYLAEPMRLQACTRYHAKLQDATVYPEEDGRVKVVFDKPQRAMTPGQALVLYDGDLVVGGGTIMSTY